MIAPETTTAAVDAQEIFEKLAGALQGHMKIDADLDEAKVREIAVQEIARAAIPQPIEVHLDNGQVKVVEGAHCQFTELVDLVEEGFNNILMVGPAGSGKTTLAKAVAEALDLDFAFISLSAGVSEAHLLGRMLPQADGTWAYVPSRFVQVYENGGVFLLDELDAADSNVMVAVNAALANGVLANPINGQIHKRHPRCVIIAAANTYGLGGDVMYVGRNQLDAATLDRFTLSTLFVDYDRELETRIARSELTPGQADELLAWVTTLRKRIADARLRRIASTRLIVGGVKKLRKGRTLDSIKKSFYQNWSRDEVAKLGGAL